MTTAFRREQRGTWLKRVLWRPFGPAALRIGQGKGPVALRALALRRGAFPYLRAKDEPFEQQLDHGVFVGGTRDMLSLYVHTFGVWEPYLSEFVRGRLSPGDVFVDVGANTGWYTLLAAQRVKPGGHVVAVEASAAIVTQLERQLARNDVTNVRIVQEAVSDHEGRVTVELGPAEHTGMTKAVRAAEQGAGVPCRPLGQMLRDDEWPLVRLVKIDVEGAEFAAVRGLAASLDRLPERAEVVVEVGAHRTTDTDEVRALFATFEDAGYTGYAVPNGYEVEHYLAYSPRRSFPRIDASTLSGQVDVVFSRHGGDELPLNHD
ncbi:MAG TPA: FkbM family methyltransferase [Acidimicrobiales bacterium]|nr:FkbM family methyltransferase [Acidimicrobiales bacterium]